MKKWLIALLCLVSLFCFAYAQETIKEKNIKETIEVESEKEFMVILDSNKTTGYEWQLAGNLDKELVSLVSSDYKVENTELVGAGGKEIWTFKALKEGETEINFNMCGLGRKMLCQQSLRNTWLLLKQKSGGR